MNAGALRQEARYLHTQLFREEPPANVVDRYAAAVAACGIGGEGCGVMEKLVALRLDAEAVEFALRRRDRENALTKRMQILMYLVEVRSPYFAYFFNTERNLKRTIFHLAGSLLRSMYKLVKGQYLISRHGLV